MTSACPPFAGGAGLAPVWQGFQRAYDCRRCSSLPGQEMEKPSGLCWITLSFTPKTVTPWWAAACKWWAGTLWSGASHGPHRGPSEEGWAAGSPPEAPSLGECRSSSVAPHFVWLCLALGGWDGGLVLPNRPEVKVLVQFCPLIKKVSALQSPRCNWSIAHVTTVPELTNWSFLLFYSWGN